MGQYIYYQFQFINCNNKKYSSIFKSRLLRQMLLQKKILQIGRQQTSLFALITSIVVPIVFHQWEKARIGSTRKVPDEFVSDNWGKQWHVLSPIWSFPKYLIAWYFSSFKYKMMLIRSTVAITSNVQYIFDPWDFLTNSHFEIHYRKSISVGWQ